MGKKKYRELRIDLTVAIQLKGDAIRGRLLNAGFDLSRGAPEISVKDDLEKLEKVWQQLEVNKNGRPSRPRRERT